MVTVLLKGHQIQSLLGLEKEEEEKEEGTVSWGSTLQLARPSRETLMIMILDHQCQVKLEMLNCRRRFWIPVSLLPLEREANLGQVKLEMKPLNPLTLQPYRITLSSPPISFVAKQL